MTPNEIKDKKFSRALGFGYRTDDIEEYLENIAREMQLLLEEKQLLNEKILTLAEEVANYRNQEDGIKKAILGAQNLGDSLVLRAKNEGLSITAEARQQAEIMVDNAKRAVLREEDNLSRIRHETEEFRGELMELYRSHVQSISRIPTVEEALPAPTPEPQLAPVQEEPEETHSEVHSSVQELEVENEHQVIASLLDGFTDDLGDNKSISDLFNEDHKY